MTRSELEGVVVDKVLSKPYTREDLMTMDPVCLRALFRERVHHTIEVELYPILLGRKKMPKKFGLQAALILDVWRARGFSEEAEDIQWCKNYIEIAEKMRAGEEVQMEEVLPEPFTEQEMAVVRKLLWGRRSVRDWVKGKPVPEHLIEQILEAGRAAPCGCNLDVVRFIVIRDPKEAKMVWSDIPTPMDQCVLIVICYDTRAYETVGHDTLVPQNMLYDCAAAGDHMGLMAHALGLGAVWLGEILKSAKEVQELCGLSSDMELMAVVAVGYPSGKGGTSGRKAVEEVLLKEL